MRLFFGVRAHVNEHFVASIESATGAGTLLPAAIVEATDGSVGMLMGNVGGKLFERMEMSGNGEEKRR